MSAPFGPAELQSALTVSRETLARLETYVALLQEWNTRHNLVSGASIGEVWRRHIYDSAQLLPFIPPDAMSLLDLGSGAGFPGLVLSILLAGRPSFRTILYEATRKKCDFLCHVVSSLGVAAEVRNQRIETAVPEMFDVVTARALAPLDKLLAYAQAFQGQQTLNLFLKGQSVGAELTIARKSWRMCVAQYPSRSDLSGTILAIRELRHAV
jgi:16S rRNA (guanine527-N7)-methyltransferase